MFEAASCRSSPSTPTARRGASCGAIARGEAHVSVGVMSSLVRELHALAPGLLSRLFGELRRLMPAAGGGPVPSMAVRGETLSI